MRPLVEKAFLRISSSPEPWKWPRVIFFLIPPSPESLAKKKPRCIPGPFFVALFYLLLSDPLIS